MTAGVVKIPPFRDILWAAQCGRCWICGQQMLRKGIGPRCASVDHVWPRARYGATGDLGSALLAHRDCNSARGKRDPSDDDVRTFIRFYREIPKWWLELVHRNLCKELKAATQIRARRDLVELFLKEAA